MSIRSNFVSNEGILWKKTKSGGKRVAPSSHIAHVAQNCLSEACANMDPGIARIARTWKLQLSPEQGSHPRYSSSAALHMTNNPGEMLKLGVPG